MDAAAEGKRPALLGWSERLHRRVADLPPRTESWLIATGCTLVALAAALALVLPGKTFSAIYVHDMMIFLDGAHRVLEGQLPNRDFHTPLGLVAYLLPAAGLGIGGSFGAMMPLAHALFALLFLPMLIHVCASRLPLGYALIFAFFALMLVIGPASIGETAPSYAMFYNRWGYALLGLLFLLVLPQRRGRRRRWADSLVAAGVLLLCFYLKISYFAVAAGFTALLLLFADTRRTALGAFLFAAAGAALIHLFWGGTGFYLEDIRSVAAVTGSFRASLLGLARMALANAAMIVPFAIVLGIAFARGVGYGTLFLCLVMAGGGLLLFSQNFQGQGILTLVPAAIVAALAPPARREAAGDEAFALASLLLVAAAALPPAIISAQSILFHGLMALKGGEAGQYSAEVDGFVTSEVYQPAPGQPGFADARRAYRTGAADIETLKLLRIQALQQVLAQPEYFWTVEDGAALLRRHPRLQGKVLTLDMANPMNALTGRVPPRGVDSWYHAGRSFNENVFRPAEETFREVDVVMVPKAPVATPSHLLLMRLYGAHLAAHFEPVAASDYWLAYARKRQGRSG